MEEAENKISSENTNGMKLQEEFSYKNMLESVIKNIENN
jgi:hypothetical protein